MKFRRILPFGHLLIDCILLGALIGYSNSRLYRGDRGFLRDSTATDAVVFVQESGTVEWDPRTSGPPGSFSLIMSGNLPAGLMSLLLRPDAGIVGGRRPWDAVWFVLHEALSFPCWYLIGAWIDAGQFRLGKVLLAYLVVRFFLALSGLYEVGWRIQVLFWWGLVLWSVGLGLYRLIKVGLRAVRRAH